MIQFESTGIQNILIALVVICIVVYGYIEFKKVNFRLNELESKLNKLSNLQDNLQGIPETMNNDPIQMDQASMDHASIDMNTNTMNNIVHDKEHDIANEIANDIDNTHKNIPDKKVSNKIKSSAPDMGGLFIAVSDVNIENNIVEQSLVDERIVEITDKEDILENDVEDMFNEATNEATNEVANEVANEVTNEELPIDNEPKKEELVDPINEVAEETSYMPSDTMFSNAMSLDISDTNDNVNYEEYSIKELKNILDELGLSTSGNKHKLIERIVSHKK